MQHDRTNLLAHEYVSSANTAKYLQLQFNGYICDIHWFACFVRGTESSLKSMLESNLI